MNNSSDEEAQSHSDHSHDEDTQDSIKPLLSVADFNGDGSVDDADVRDIIARYEAVEGEDLYHPLYDTNVNGKIDSYDIENVIHALGEDVPLLDRQIAQVTQATMKYYGSGGLEQALADGYLPGTPEVKGHGIHYASPTLINEVGNLEELDIERPIGLNYDPEGNLLAVFYGRFPEIQGATPENPFGELIVNQADDFPPSSFDTLTADDWHTHQSLWATGVGSLNAESVYIEEDVPVEAIISRLQDTDFQLFPQSDQSYSPKLWMLHGWFHSLNPAGTFANTHPDVAPYAPQLLEVHGGHDHGDSDPLIAGTDQGEQLVGTDEDDQINGFGGDDWIAGGLGNDLIWGSYGDDSLRGDDDNSSEGGNDMLYGGPGNDLIYGHAGDDRLFGATEDDIMAGGEGDDLLRGSLGYDILTGDEGRDTFVLAPGEGTDIITDLELDLDTIVLYAGITTESIAIKQIGSDTALGFNNETLAIVSGIDASDLMAVSNDVFLVA